MARAVEFRPAAGWLARRLAERAEGMALLTDARRGVPPRRLRARVGAAGAADFRGGGAAAAQQLVAALAPRPIAGFASVLDFGCGAARVLGQLSALLDPDARSAGVDVDAEAIAWASAHVPGSAFDVCAALPPLPFADAEFDLIYSISVFSHLSEPAQDAWLTELARTLAPGGVALVSTHGSGAFEAFRSGAVRTAWCAPDSFARGALDVDEVVAIPYRASRWSRGDLPGVGEGYGLTFHGSGYIRERWGARGLTVEQILPQAVSGWQDLVLLSRPL